MRLRYSFLLAGLCCLGLASTTAAQNREVSGTTDANGIYVQQTGLINGKTYYLAEGGSAIYYCDDSTPFSGGETPCATGNPTSGLWVIASELYNGPSTPSASRLYFSVRPVTEAEAPVGGYFALNGQPNSATVTETSLPVELVSFEAVASGQRVHLRWATASETNNAGFTVEMQVGEAFAEQGFVSGNGTTLEVHQYAFDAGERAPGRYVFRLKQVDFDGAVEYSPEVEVTVESAGALYLSVPQPNPAREAAHFSVATQQAQPLTVRLYDLLGRVVQTIYEGEMAAGEAQTFRLERGSLPAGVYLIRLQGPHLQDTQRLTLL